MLLSDTSRRSAQLLVWDGMCQRRLHQSKFTWPKADDALWQITAQEWQWLVTGVNWQRLSAHPDSLWMLWQIHL